MNNVHIFKITRAGVRGGIIKGLHVHKIASWGAGVSGKNTLCPGGGGNINASSATIHPHVQELPAEIKGGLEVLGRLGQCGACSSGHGDLLLRERRDGERHTPSFPELPRMQSGRALKVRRVGSPGDELGTQAASLVPRSS